MVAAIGSSLGYRQTADRGKHLGVLFSSKVLRMKSCSAHQAVAGGIWWQDLSDRKNTLMCSGKIKKRKDNFRLNLANFLYRHPLGRKGSQPVKIPPLYRALGLWLFHRLPVEPVIKSLGDNHF